jgi:hypothetical protein
MSHTLRSFDEPSYFRPHTADSFVLRRLYYYFTVALYAAKITSQLAQSIVTIYYSINGKTTEAFSKNSAGIFWV